MLCIDRKFVPTGHPYKRANRHWMRGICLCHATSIKHTRITFLPSLLSDPFVVFVESATQQTGDENGMFSRVLFSVKSLSLKKNFFARHEDAERRR